MHSKPDNSDIETCGGDDLVPARTCNTSMQQNPDLTVPTRSRTLAASLATGKLAPEASREGG